MDPYYAIFVVMIISGIYTLKNEDTLPIHEHYYTNVGNLHINIFTFQFSTLQSKIFPVRMRENTSMPITG
jgi:hypothetical protein